ncbi:alpha-N-arabinofuranosidase [Sunxiuqinia sp. A32]|uniref:alpha-N-arabinofuranosidase n=1 Tax=Sunxiuqinia sp. A32 TaxID=3461496 RepID=UPI0040466806
MKTIARQLTIALISIFLTASITFAQNNQARIKLDIERQIGEIDKMIYGNFVEHLGRCIYGGIYEPGSPLSDENGFRKDVMKATKELNVPIIRWPGGNFVSGYHWEDGIGPVDQRPTRIDLAWGFREDNSFGTDEYIDWCREVNTEPYFCVNLGTGTMDEARNWVEYCNVEKGTYYSDLRIKNGHKGPHNVKYWGLGNEMDGHWQMGHKNAEDYGKFALEASKLMKWIDKDIKLVAAGSSNYGGDWIHWNRRVLEYLVHHVDYIALHNYVENRENNYYKFMATTQFAEEAIKITEGIIREELSKAKRIDPIYIAFDEYNVWYRAQGQEGNEEIYNLEDALVVATYLNIFVRNAHIVKMANLAQLVNVIAPIFTTEKGLFYQTIFYPLQLFANNCFGTAIDAFVDCDTYQVKDREVPYLDVSSAYDKENDKIILNVVNRHKDTAISTEISSQYGIFNGEATISVVNGNDIKDENSMEKQMVKTQTSSMKVKGEEFTYSFPAHSYTMITIPVEAD